MSARKKALKLIKKVKKPLLKKCPRCGVNPASKLHTCPFKEEHDDNSLCACCPSCAQECYLIVACEVCKKEFSLSKVTL